MKSRISVGDRFGRLVVLRWSEQRYRSEKMVDCRCDCGKEKTYRTCVLLTGNTTSCGCFRLEQIRARSKGVRLEKPKTASAPPEREHVIVGGRYGRFVVLSEFHKITSRRNRLWCHCLCDCGTAFDVRSACVVGGQESCGCIVAELSSARARKHGMAETSTYRAWLALRGRCNNPNTHGYKWYGGKGIRVCERWESSFAAFLSDMGERPSRRHSVDRLDGNKGYEPSNCRWATELEQGRNRSNVIRVEWMGRTVALSELAAEYGIQIGTARGRYKRGLPLDVVLGLKKTSTDRNRPS